MKTLYFFLVKHIFYHTPLLGIAILLLYFTLPIITCDKGVLWLGSTIRADIVYAGTCLGVDILYVLLFQIGSFFMINLCLVVIATQFSETKKREMERMRQERARYQSTSTLASSTNNSEPTSCYSEIVKSVAYHRQTK